MACLVSWLMLFGWWSPVVLLFVSVDQMGLGKGLISAHFLLLVDGV